MSIPNVRAIAFAGVDPLLRAAIPANADAERVCRTRPEGMIGAAANLSGRILLREDAVLNALAANTSTVLVLLAGACGLLLLAVIAHTIRGRAPRGPALTGEDAIRRDLAEINRRLAALEQGTARIAEALPQSVQGVGVIRYNPFPEMGGNMSFSLALLDGRENGVVISVLNDRTGSRVYGKAVEQGASSHPLSDEERQALAQARGSRC